VEPGADHDSLCNEVIEEITQLKDINTVDKAVGEAVRVIRIRERQYID
jgi:hypothetical protein